METDVTEEVGEDHILQHYGIKGMQWGVRRPRGSDGRVKGSGKKGESADRQKLNKTQKKAKKSGVGSLTNNEIQQATNRINLEMKYSSLNPSKGRQVLSSVAKGTAAVGTILAVGKAANEAIAFANSPVGQQMKKRFSGSK